MINEWMSVESGKYRITFVLKVETDIINSNTVSPIGQDAMLVIMYVKTFKSDVFVFIYNIVMLSSY